MPMACLAIQFRRARIVSTESDQFHYEPLSIQNPRVGTSEDRLLLDDLIRYLSQLAALNKGDRTGNPELSDSLRQLARALRPHANRLLDEAHLPYPFHGSRRLSDWLGERGGKANRKRVRRLNSRNGRDTR